MDILLFRSGVVVVVPSLEGFVLLMWRCCVVVDQSRSVIGNIKPAGAKLIIRNIWSHIELMVSDGKHPLLEVTYDILTYRYLFDSKNPYPILSSVGTTQAAVRPVPQPAGNPFQTQKRDLTRTGRGGS